MEAGVGMGCDQMCGRRYERGQNRQKHVGSTGMPEIVRHSNDEIIGKCPANFPETRRKKLLDEAIPHITSPPYSAEFPKRLYVVDHDGTVYTGQTTNPGDSYHGYPYSGIMGKRLIAALREMAQQKNCEQAFNSWVKRYIDIGGKPDL